MNLIILDKDFRPIAAVNTLQTLIWDRRYREPGTFEIHAGAADFPGIREGAYLYRDDREELGVIYEADIQRNKSGARVCYAKGYFGEALLNDRVLNVTQRLSGTPEEIARELVDKFFINTADTDGDYDGRSLGERLALGPLSGETLTTIKWQGTGSAVGALLYDLEAAQNLSHRITYDYANDRLLFSVYKGKDRRAILSDQYGNLTQTSYHRDTTDAPNVVYVAGAGEGTSRKVFFLDLRQAGEPAREMYVDARDLQQNFTGEDGQSYSYTDQDYNDLLEARGRQKAAEHKAQERFEAQADAHANLIYREDYDLGDFCVAEFDGIRKEKQITGIRETYEAGKETIEITLGDYGPTSIQQMITRQAQVNTQPAAPSTGNVGDLNQLNTTDKTGVVPAINEVNNGVGDLSKLQTTAKGSLVDAINEIAQGGGGGGGGGSGTDASTAPISVIIQHGFGYSELSKFANGVLIGLSRNLYASGVTLNIPEGVEAVIPAPTGDTEKEFKVTFPGTALVTIDNIPRGLNGVITLSGKWTNEGSTQIGTPSSVLLSSATFEGHISYTASSTLNYYVLSAYAATPGVWMNLRGEKYPGKTNQYYATLDNGIKPWGTNTA